MIMEGYRVPLQGGGVGVAQGFNQEIGRLRFKA